MQGSSWAQDLIRKVKFQNAAALTFMLFRSDFGRNVHDASLDADYQIEKMLGYFAMQPFITTVRRNHVRLPAHFTDWQVQNSFGQLLLFNNQLMLLLDYGHRVVQARVERVRVDPRNTDVVIVALAGVVLVEVAGRSQSLSRADALRLTADEASRIASIDARAGAAAVVRLV